ncbi:MAG: outer membrane protein assembly factor BamE domain-containing protein [Lysobacteraceae bacterium]
MEQTPTFDSGAWKAQRGVAAKDNTRGGMVAAVEAAVHPGMSREDVLRLLGEPDATDAATSTDTYELGVARFGVDEEYFAIHYRDGKVESRQWQRR